MFQKHIWHPTNLKHKFFKHAFWVVPCLLGLLVHFQSIQTPFLLDDYLHFVENQNIQNAKNVKEVLFNGYQETRPLYNLTLALQAKLFGVQSSFEGHVFNLLIFLLTLFAYVRVLCCLNVEKKIILFSSLLLACHPWVVPSLAYMNSRSGLMGQMFVMLALWSFLRPMKSLWGIGFLCLWLAMASKEDAFSGVIICLYFLWHQRGKIGTRFIHFVGWLLAFLFPVLLYMVFSSPHVGTIGQAVASPWMYAAKQSVYIPLHLATFFVPWPLTFYWDIPPIFESKTLWVLAWFFFLLPLLFFLWKYQKHLWAKALTWSLLGLAPTHSLVPLLDVHAPRFFYPALPGMCLFLGVILFELHTRKKEVATVLLLGLVIFFSHRSLEQIRMYQNPLQLWEANAAAAPSRWRVWSNLSIEYGERKIWQQAEECAQKALELAPNQSNAWYNYAVIWFARNDGKRDTQKAKKYLLRTLTLYPSHPRALLLLKKIEQR